MPYFHVNKNSQANRDHEVHQNGCGHQPDLANRLALGLHATCRGAVQEAKMTYRQSNGCYYCCRECHTG